MTVLSIDQTAEQVLAAWDAYWSIRWDGGEQ